MQLPLMYKTLFDNLMPQNKMNADKIDISSDLIKDLLFKQFPKWAYLPLKLMHPE